jgi:site-specific recombinase XerD
VSHLEKFKMHELARVQPTSVNIFLRHVKSALSFAVRNGYLGKNPAAAVSLCRVPTNSEPRYLTEVEIEKLREGAADNPELLQMIDFSLRTGARRAELTNIRWADIDLDRGIVYIKNREGFTTKSKRSRAIPMSERLREMLVGMRSEGMKPEYRVFNMSYWRFGTCFRDAVQKAGLPASITPHVLRHSFCSHMIMRGVPIATVKELMGHASISTSLIYTHLSEGHFSDSVNRLPF